MGWGKGCIRFWGRLDQNCGCHGNQKLPLIYNGENGVSTFSQSFLIGSSPNLRVSKTDVKSKIVQIPPGFDYSLQSCMPLSTGKFLIDYNQVGHDGPSSNYGSF